MHPGETEAGARRLRPMKLPVGCEAVGGRCIAIAESDLPNLLIAFEGDKLPFGATTNPYDGARTFGASSSGEAALRPPVPVVTRAAMGPDACAGQQLCWESPPIKPTSGRLSRTVTFRRAVDGPSVCGRSGRRHHHIRRPRSSAARRRLPCRAPMSRRAPAMIARGNVLNRITLPEGTEAAGPLTGYFVAAPLKQREAPV